MKDLIDRQAAIDALMAWEEDSIWDEECLKHRGEPFWVSPSDVIEKLPPAQPEIIRCKDCEYYKSYTLYGQTQGFCNRLGLQATEIDDFCSRAERRNDEAD